MADVDGVSGHFFQTLHSERLFNYYYYHSPLNIVGK
jgi:hypothetical protein